MQSSVSFVRLIGLSTVFAAVPLIVHAQGSPSEWNHFGLNLRTGFNIGAKFGEPTFSEFSGGAALPPGPGAGSDVNRRYNDGYVNVDSSGNTGGQTWNWGYNNASQLSGSDVLMHANGPAEGGTSGRQTDDPNLGLDFNYVRDIAHDHWGQWGIKIAFGYTPVEINDDNPLGETEEKITDAYQLGTVTAPLPPYSGTFGGPGPLLNSLPTRSTSISEAEVTGNHNVDAALYDLRLGPSFDIPLSRRFSMQAGGGLALGLVDSDFTYSESGALSGSGGDTRTGGLIGGYAEFGFAYRMTHSLSLFAGTQWEDLGTFHQTADGRTASLDFSDMIFSEFGLQWRF